MDNWNVYLNQKFAIGGVDLRTYSPLTLAYIGDGIYELLIRTVLVCRKNTQANKLHRRTSSIVRAVYQSQLIEYLLAENQLTEEEIRIYKRGRNAFTQTRAKNASASEYRKATGFEALMGYLYLKGETNRAIDLIKYGLEGTGENI